MVSYNVARQNVQSKGDLSVLEYTMVAYGVTADARAAPFLGDGLCETYSSPARDLQDAPTTPILAKA